MNREHKRFEILAFQGIEYTTFLRECEERERMDCGPVPSSLATDLPRL